MISHWPVIVVAMLALSGCATTWSRAATSDAELNLDNRACQHMNTQTVSLSSVRVRDYVAVSGYKRCMLQEGYSGRILEGASGVAGRVTHGDAGGIQGWTRWRTAHPSFSPLASVDT